MTVLKTLFCLCVQAVFASMLVAQTAQTEPTAAETEFARSWISAISASSSDEDILLAIMLAQRHQPASVAGLLGMELDAPAHDKNRLSLAWYYCRNNAGAELCMAHSFADELIAVDPANVDPYLYSTLTLLDAGRDIEALSVLTAGNAATEANTWYLDRLTLVRERLRASGYPQDRINLAAEDITGALDTYFLYAKLLSVCAVKSAESAAWKTQCLALGSKLETLGNTVVQNVHGFAIQRDALGGIEDSATKAAIVEELAAFNRIRDLARDNLDWIDDVSRKPDLVYEETIEFGEIQALERALQRLEE